MHASNLRSLQHELDLAKDAAQTAREHHEQTSRSVQQELSHWREKCQTLDKQVQQHVSERGILEADLAQNQSGEAVSELKRQIHSLVDELNALSARNEDLLEERERHAQEMSEMEARVEEYKRMYDSVRVELRNLKATSMMFTSRPATDDHLPASPDGNIADIHVSAFQNAIDGMLTAARSSAPSGVLPAMKAIVEAITEIGEDVQAFEANPNIDVDVSRLESLKHESTTRLNGLMQAARNHAMASGLSPVSLIDGAAGHLSSNVIEIIKLLRIRRTDKNGLSRSRSNLSIRDMVDRSRGGVSPVSPTGDAKPQIHAEQQHSQAQAQLQRQQSQPYQSQSQQPQAQQSQSGGRQGWGMQSTSSEEYLSEPRSVQPLVLKKEPTESRPIAPRSPVESQMDTRNGRNVPNLRINSYQSASSVARSDSFDLDRSSSLHYERPVPRAAPAPAPESSYQSQSQPQSQNPPQHQSRMNGHANRTSEASEASGSTSVSSGPPAPITANTTDGFRSYDRIEPSIVSPTSHDHDHGVGMGLPNGHVDAHSPVVPVQEESKEEEPGMEGSEQEWDDVKPYLDTQSSALVNSIQNLLAAIRTGGQTPALNEHLSEVIAIASSIVAVASNALPPSLRPEGSPLIKDLVENTNKLSEAQEVAQRGGFDRTLRQTIASASFGVAKSLKALMRLGKPI